MELRESDPDDAAAIRAVARESLHASYDDILGEDTVEAAADRWYDPDELEAELAAEDLSFLVAVEDDEVVGFAQVHLRTEQEEARVQWLHVRPDRRGEGVGGRLLEYARETLRSRGAGRITGAVLAANEPGNDFYREHGFVLEDQYTIEVGEEFVAENVYADVAEEETDLEAVETPEGTMYADRADEHRGSRASFYPVYRSEDGSRRYGWLCAGCETTDNAMDAMGRIQCNSCGNARKPERWDAAYL